jgi:shikimate dehydrogenase
LQYALIGEKLGHSFSKQIHESVFGYSYELCELNKDELDAFFEKKDFLGINVTIPYKQAVIKYLDEIDQSAKKIGAVNTIVNRGGRLVGYNTDFFGMKSAFLAHCVDLTGLTVLILGTGGTSLTAKAVCEDMGAEVIKRVSRNPKSDDEISYTQAKTDFFDADVIINTTPLGMYPNSNACAVDLNDFPFVQAVLDAVYNPINTLFVVNAKERGINAFSGLFMLVAQAVKAGELFLDKVLPQECVVEEYNRILKQKQNVVLLGMPSSGKTTVGKALSQIMGREFIDTDDEIIKKAGMSIPEIFATKGESAFRDIETDVIKEVSTQNGKVISLGGGAVLREENVLTLKQNGVLVYLNRPFEMLTPTADRPLSSDFDTLKKRFDQRTPIYEAVCDVTVFNDGDILDTVNCVKEMFLL